ncbi:MAG: hypothetical protein HZA93_29285 [Verrucomicrobia bacterium]|nr:hypothetical protein [Verrucomicrobiota bacterium]
MSLKQLRDLAQWHEEESARWKMRAADCEGAWASQKKCEAKMFFHRDAARDLKALADAFATFASLTAPETQEPQS